MISNNNNMDISFEEYSINKENTGLHSEDYFHFKENLFDIKQKRKSEYKFNIVTIFADSGERYISTGVFDE